MTGTEHQMDNAIQNILNMTHSYQKSFTVVTSCQLKIFSHLYNKALSLEEIANLCEITNKEMFCLLLDVCVEIGLLSKSGNLYRNTVISNKLLAENSHSYIGDIILLSLDYSKCWDNLISFLRNGDSDVKYQNIVDKLSEDAALRYVNGMHALSNLLGPEIVNVVDLSGKRKLLDIGGGSGGYSILFAERYNQLKIDVLELERMAKYTKEIVSKSKLADRINVITGDIFKDDLPSDNDVVFISNFIHWYSRADNQKMLSKIHCALSAGGNVIIHDFMDENVQYMSFALFSLSRYLVTKQARAYHYDEVGSWLQQSGFTDVKIITLDNVARTTLITAKK